MLPQEQLLPLITSQLKSYGYYGIARNLQEAAQLPSVDPNNKLAEFCSNMVVDIEEVTPSFAQVGTFIRDPNRGHLFSFRNYPTGELHSVVYNSTQRCL